MSLGSSHRPHTAPSPNEKVPLLRVGSAESAHQGSGQPRARQHRDSDACALKAALMPASLPPMITRRIPSSRLNDAEFPMDSGSPLRTFRSAIIVNRSLQVKQDALGKAHSLLIKIAKKND